MGFYELKQSMTMNRTIDEIWNLSSSSKYLKKFTPDYRSFAITTKDLPEKKYPVMIISYTAKPLSGLKTPWVTEITHVNEMEYFTNEQQVSPYTIRHHEHFIKPIKEGIFR